MYGLGTWLASAVLLGAAIIVVHVALLLAVWRAERSGALHRVLAIVPPLLPVVAWRLGLRRLPAFWAVLVCAYVTAYLILWATR